MSRMMSRDHGSPNVSNAKLMGQAERLRYLCFIFARFPCSRLRRSPGTVWCGGHNTCRALVVQDHTVPDAALPRNRPTFWCGDARSAFFYHTINPDAGASAALTQVC